MNNNSDTTRENIGSSSRWFGNFVPSWPYTNLPAARPSCATRLQPGRGSLGCSSRAPWAGSRDGTRTFRPGTCRSSQSVAEEKESKGTATEKSVLEEATEEGGGGGGSG